MTEVIVFPDVEMLLCNRLRLMLSARPEAFTAGVVVANYTPNPIPERLITVRCDGGSRLDAVRQATRCGFNVWGRNYVEAGNLARLNGALLTASPDGTILHVRNVTAPTLIPDENQDRIHMYFTGEVLVRGTA